MTPMTVPKKDIGNAVVGDDGVVKRYKAFAVMEYIPAAGPRDRKAGHWTCCRRAGGKGWWCSDEDVEVLEQEQAFEEY